MKPTAIYSKSGKGVQEASGKTSLLNRADRAVLSAIDGRANLGDVAQKCGKKFDPAFEQLVTKLDKDGFVREISPSTAAAPAAPARPAAPPRPVAKPAAPSAPGEDLDFSALSVPQSKPKPAAPPPPDPKAAAEAERRAQEQASPLVKARQEADARAQKDRDRIKAEADAQLRGEALNKGHAEREEKLRADAEAKVKIAREAALRAAAEAKARADAEIKAAVEAERRKAEAERQKAEAERQKAEAERKAREEAERRAREEVERARKEAEEKARREAEELRKKLEEERAKAEAERRAREEAERKARGEAERRAREAEEKARAESEALRRQLEEERRKLEEERRQRAQEEERRAQQEAERTREAQAKAAAAAADTTPRAVVPPPAAAPLVADVPAAPAALAAPTRSFDDSLLADLDSFGKREEEERKAKEEAERQVRAAAERKAKEAAERQAREEAERERRADEERRRQEEEARRAREEDERRAREEVERARNEAEERKRKARESQTAARQSKPAPVPAAAGDDDIGVTDDDLDMEDVKQDERVLGATARRAAHEAAKAEPVADVAPAKRRRRIKWGKALAIALIVLVVAGVGLVHVVPLPSADYEKAASAALGRPVKIGATHLSLFTGLQLKFQGVSFGDGMKIGTVHAYPQAGTLFGERKSFSRIELDGLTLPQEAIGRALLAKVKSENFDPGRIVFRKLKLQGPLALPPIDVDIAFGEDGAVLSATLRGPENLTARLAPKDSQIGIDLTADRFTLPIAPDVTLNGFAMKGSATVQGMNVASWDGTVLDGRLSGSANVRWGDTWSVEGAFTVRGMNAAVFAPALVSEGKAEGSGRFSMSGPAPEKLLETGRVEGNFTISKGVLGSFDLSRAIQSGGKQASGRTQFTELAGQGVYDKGAVALRNVTVVAGALNAGASADIAQSGALSGRIVADIKTASQTLRATLSLGGTVKEPQVKN